MWVVSADRVNPQEGREGETGLQGCFQPTFSRRGSWDQQQPGTGHPTPDLCNQKLEVGPCQLCFNAHSRYVCCKLKLETPRQSQTSRRFRVRESLRSVAYWDGVGPVDCGGASHPRPTWWEEPWRAPGVGVAGALCTPSLGPAARPVVGSHHDTLESQTGSGLDDLLLGKGFFAWRTIELRAGCLGRWNTWVMGLCRELV